MGEADRFGLGKFLGRIDIPKRQPQRIVQLDFLRGEEAHLHFWEPGDGEEGFQDFGKLSVYLWEN
jgi:hypothetical protein